MRFLSLSSDSHCVWRRSSLVHALMYKCYERLKGHSVQQCFVFLTVLRSLDDEKISERVARRDALVSVEAEGAGGACQGHAHVDSDRHLSYAQFCCCCALAVERHGLVAEQLCKQIFFDNEVKPETPSMRLQRCEAMLTGVLVKLYFSISIDVANIAVDATGEVWDELEAIVSYVRANDALVTALSAVEELSMPSDVGDALPEALFGVTATQALPIVAVVARVHRGLIVDRHRMEGDAGASSVDLGELAVQRTPRPEHLRHQTPPKLGMQVCQDQLTTSDARALVAQHRHAQPLSEVVQRQPQRVIVDPFLGRRACALPTVVQTAPPARDRFCPVPLVGCEAKLREQYSVRFAAACQRAPRHVPTPIVAYLPPPGEPKAAVARQRSPPCVDIPNQPHSPVAAPRRRGKQLTGTASTAEHRHGSQTTTHQQLPSMSPTDAVLNTLFSAPGHQSDEVSGFLGHLPLLGHPPPRTAGSDSCTTTRRSTPSGCLADPSVFASSTHFLHQTILSSERGMLQVLAEQQRIQQAQEAQEGHGSVASMSPAVMTGRASVADVAAPRDPRSIVAASPYLCHLLGVSPSSSRPPSSASTKAPRVVQLAERLVESRAL